MAPIKCCVLGCSSTTQTHHLFNLPKNDKLRALWMSFLVPVNSQLLGLSKDQLLNKRVCQKHFDRYQLGEKGHRLKFGYPSLFSAEEIEHGMPLTGDNNDHNYSKKVDFEEMVEEDPVVAQEHPVDHQYLRPASPASLFLSNDVTTVNILELGEIPLTSECEELVMQIDSLESQDSTTVVFESSEMPPTSECEESLHDLQIDSLESLHDIQIAYLEPQGIESDQNLQSDSSGLIHLQPKASFESNHLQPKPSFGSEQSRPCLQSDYLEPKPSFGFDHLKPKPYYGSDHLQPMPTFGTVHLQPKPSFIERYRFRQRIQKPDESIMQYISELEEMTIFCDFKTVLKEHLRDQLIWGLRSEQIRRRMFAEESLDYAKAVEIACAMEAAETYAGVVEQTFGRDAESGDREVATRVLHGDSGDAQRGFANDKKNICSVCGSADHWGEGCGQSKQKGHLNRACQMRPGRQQGRCDSDNMGSRQLKGRCDTDNMGSRQLKGRCDTDNMGSRQLQGRCDTDDKRALAPAASGVTGQLDLVDQLDAYLPPSSDKENWETEEDLQQLGRKGYKRLVIWVDEAQLPMDIDMESFVSCIRKT